MKLLNPAHALGSIDASNGPQRQQDTTVSISHLKMLRWRECLVDFAFRGACDESRDMVLQAWNTFGHKNSPYGVFAFRVSSSGLINGLDIRSEGSDKDNFFYLQAAWESAPILVRNRHVLGDPETLSLSFTLPAHRHKYHQGRGRNNLVFVHLIPAGVLRMHPNLFTGEEIEDKSNCFEFDIKLADSLALQSFRTEWVEFWRAVPHPSREQVWKKSAELGEILKLQLQ
jgi:hypothetical protein